jgi:hypothetical protein
VPDWDVVWIIVALAVIPSADLAKILVAVLAKRLGVSPREIEEYQQVTDGDGDAADDPEAIEED